MQGKTVKVLVWTIGIVAALYVIAAICACFLLPKKIADADSRLFGVRVAIAQLSKDQWLVSERMRVITSQTLSKGKSKLDEVTAILEDPDLNHLALVYLGADWAIQRSSFLGHISHSRKLLEMQKEERKKQKSRLNEKITELEARKRALLKSYSLRPKDRFSELKDAWHIEMEDIDRQLKAYRNSNTYREYMAKDETDARHIEALAKNEDNLFKLANEYMEKTMGQLSQVMAERLSELRWEENRPVQLRRAASVFNVWPISAIMDLSIKESDAKRL